MKLRNLCKDIDIIISDSQNIEVLGISSDSREIKQGDMFIAIKGEHHDGNDHIQDVINNGASVIVCSKDFNEPFQGVKLIVEDTYNFSLSVAQVFYGFPSKFLNMIGVTGTNGKTTVAHILESIYKEYGHKTGLVGTIVHKILDQEYVSLNTTPQALYLQKLLKKMIDKGVQTVCMEVSSHALSLGRIKGCEFDIGIFTNLSQDHLDFHNSMEEYCLAKKKLFNLIKQDMHSSKKAAIINGDDEYCEKIKQDISCPVVLYGQKKNYDIQIKELKYNVGNMKFLIAVKNGETIEIETDLIGMHNAYNICAAFAAAYIQKIPLDCIKKGIENVKRIPGRCELIKEGQEFSCIVDYAHTDDALKNILEIAKNLTSKRVITVFGCGGSRDRKKRPLMGEAAALGSDFIFITSDNPRDEDPSRIVLNIEVGIKRLGKENYKVIIDRAKAIEEALYMAEKGDVVLIAGKGHETYQIVKDEHIHFDDREISRKIIHNILDKKKEKFLFDDKSM